MPVGADKDDIRGKLQGALGAQVPADPRPQQSLSDQIKQNVGQAALAATAGQPGATSAAPQEPGKPPKPKTIAERLAAISEVSGGTIPLVYRAQDVELPIDEVRRLAQKGMSIDNIEQQRAALQADKGGFEAFKAWQRWLQSHPQEARAVQDIYEGRPQRMQQQAIPRTQSYGDEDLGATALEETPAQRAAAADPELMARLDRLETLWQGQQRDQQRRTFDNDVTEAASRNAFLRAHPDRVAMAKDLAAASLAAGECNTFDEAITYQANRLRRMVEAEMDSIREQRERQTEHVPPVTPAGRPYIPPMPKDQIASGSKGLRRGKDTIREWLASAQRGAVNGPG